MIASAGRLIIKRSQIHKAPYNPRTISEARRNKLATSLRRYGMVVPLVWNKQTGNLVGGHQRLDILDADNLQTHGGGDYDVEVSAVDLPLIEEKKLNVILNSREIGGEFVEEDLNALLDEIAGGSEIFDIRTFVSDAEEKSKTRVNSADKKSKKAAGIDATFEIVIKCANEQDQKAKFEKLTAEGYSCRVLVL
jgi:hypothetical protein